jgi:plasmid stabilization system protein ParE
MSSAVTRRYRVEITAAAERDIQLNHDYIAGDKPRAAANWVGQIKRQIRSLASMPMRCEIIPEAEDVGIEYRHIIFGQYRTIFRIMEKRVIILRVIHGARLFDLSFLNVPF